MSAVSLRRAAVRASATSSLQTTAKRHASAEYAHMKVKKINWVEQNEVLRENKFVNWTIDGKNIIPVVMLGLVVPVFFYSVIKGEMAQREEKRGVKVEPRW